MISPMVARAARVGLLFVLVTSGWLVMMFARTSYAQSDTLQWSRAIPVSGALAGSRYPSIVAEDNGNVFLFWGFIEPGTRSTIFVSKFDGAAWTRPVDILFGGPRVLATLDGRGTIRLMFQSGENISLRDSNIHDATSVRGWTGGTNIDRGGANVLGDYALDAQSNIYSVWFQGIPDCKECYSIAYEKAGQGIDTSLSYRVLSDSETPPQRRLQLLRTLSETMYAMWDAPANDPNKVGIELTLSENGGETWLAEPRVLAFTQEDIRQPLLIADKNGALLLVYNFGDKDEVFYSTSTDRGTTWTEPTPIPGLFSSRENGEDNYFAAATDSAGNTHLIAPGRAAKTQVESGLYHVQWDGTAWSRAQEMYRGNTTVDYPAIAIGNGNRLHVSFATSDRNPVGGSADRTFQVWYTTAQTQAPAQTRVPLPTFTPVPTSTPQPEPTSTASPTSTPTPLPLDPQVTAPVTGAVNTQEPIVIAIGVVILVLVIVIGVNTLLRRRS